MSFKLRKFCLPACVATTFLITAAGAWAQGIGTGPNTYARLEFGGTVPSFGNAHWLPPGRSDPQVNFDADGDGTGFGAIAIGYDWQNGLRADLSLFGTGTSDITAPCASASDGSSCSTHADITAASVQTTGFMANLFYSPLAARGSNSVFQPFVVAGVGVAQNDVGDWTRSNGAAPRPVRTFEGDTTTGVAWSVGAGAAIQVGNSGRWPVMLEATWRYYDFGSASGSSTPLPGNGISQPRQAFTFDNTDHVFTLGVRIPLQRN